MKKWLSIFIIIALFWANAAFAVECMLLAPPVLAKDLTNEFNNQNIGRYHKTEALKQFKEFLPLKFSIKDEELLKYIISSNMYYAKDEPDNPAVTIVFNGDLAQRIGYTLLLPDRKISKIIYCVDKNFEAITVFCGNAGKSLETLLCNRAAMGGLLCQHAYTDRDIKELKKNALTGSIFLAQASDCTNEYNHIGFDGARTILITKGEKIKQKKILKKFACACYDAGILGNTLCLVRGFGVTSNDMAYIANCVYTEAIERYLKRKEGIISEDGRNLLESIKKTYDWNKLYECIDDVGIRFPPASGILLDESYSLGLGFELQAATTLIVLEKIFSNDRLKNFVFGDNREELDILMGNYGESGNAICHALLHSNFAKKHPFKIVGLFNQKSGIYITKGISQLTLEEVKRKTKQDHPVNLRKIAKHMRIRFSSPDATIAKPAHIFINATKYDFLTPGRLRSLARAGVKLIIDFSVTQVTDEMIEIFKKNGMIFIPSTLTRSIDNFIAQEEIIHDYYGVSRDQNVAKYLVHHVIDEVYGRMAAGLDYMFEELLKHNFEKSITKNIFQRVKESRSLKNKILENISKTQFAVIIPELRKSRTSNDIKQSAEKVQKFIDANSSQLNINAKNTLVRVVRFMRIGVEFDIAFEYSLIREAECIEIYSGKKAKDFIGRLNSNVDIERIAAARHIANIGVSDEQIIDILIDKIIDNEKLKVAKDINSSVRANCIRALGYINIMKMGRGTEEKIYNCLLRALTDPSDNVRYAVRWALQGLGFTQEKTNQKINEFKKEIHALEIQLIKAYDFEHEDKGLIQGLHETLGERYYNVAALYDYLHDYKNAQAYYKFSISNYRTSNYEYGGLLVFHTQLRVARVLLQEGQWEEGINALLKLIDPSMMARLLISSSDVVQGRATKEKWKDDFESGQLCGQAIRQDALFEYFNFFREQHLFPDPYDLAVNLNEIIKKLLENPMMKNFINQNTIDDRLKAIELIAQILPEDVNDPYFRILALFGITIYYEDTESFEHIKNALKYFIIHRTFSDEEGNIRSPDDIRFLLENRAGLFKDTPIARLTKEEKQELLFMLSKLKIISNGSHDNLIMRSL